MTSSKIKTKNKFGYIRFRLVGAYLGIIVLALMFISTYVLTSISQYLYNQNQVELLANANVVANMVSEYVEDDKDIIPVAVSRLNLGDSVRVIVTDKDAVVLYDSANEQANIEGKTLVTPEVISAINGTDSVNRYDEAEIGTIIQGAVSVISESNVIGVVYLSETAKATDDFLADIKWILIVIAFIVCILIGVLSFVMADVIISPIEKLTKVINKMKSGSLEEKVEVNGNDEIAQLGDAFNQLTNRLNEMEEKRRQFVSNASHELKTPLSSIKLLCDSVLSMETMDEEYVREFMGDINGEVDRLTKIINRLLSLTKLDINYEELELKVTDINEMAQRIVKSIMPVALDKSIKIHLFTDNEVLAMVDREKFWQVLYNITDNAVKYTPEGGTVSLYVFSEGDYVRIEVIDNGIGIPADQIDKIFDRFYRVDKARSRESGGTGLGLSIVKDVVDSHNGEIIVDSKENDGTKFVIVIPKNL